MYHFRSISKLTVLGAAVVVGMTACSDEPTSLRLPAGSAAVSLELSSDDVPVGSRVGVAVRVRAAATPNVVGIQGALRFDPARLEFVGQSEGTATAIINPEQAASGTLPFTSFDLGGLEGQVAHLVFEVRGAGYAGALKYDHYKASAYEGGLRRATIRVEPTDVDVGVPVRSDARVFGFNDWKATMIAAGEERSVSLRPGDLGTLNLQFGDVDYNGAIGLDDYLAVAFVAVGLDEMIVGTDGPARDVDLVMAGNVAPNNGTVGAPACGTNGDGSRVLDLDDYLGIAFFAVSLPTEPCIGAVIPGRGPQPNPVSDRQIIGAATTPDLIVGSGETLTLTKDKIWQLNGVLRVQSGGVLNIEAGTEVQGNSAMNPTAIQIERGGQIFANGTQYEPIVLTCTGSDGVGGDAGKSSGCWSGLWISGRGTVNRGTELSPDGGCPANIGEAGLVGSNYGGCNPADNSGSLSYMVIEFAGFVVAANRELNCLTLAAVGSATQVHHIQCHGGLDDGVEFFGGSVSTHHMLLTANNDDGFDCSFGVASEHQFYIIQHDAGDAANDSKAIECDGNEPAPGTEDLPRTSPRLFNFTIIGNLTTTTQAASMHIRRGAGLRLYNSVIAGWNTGLDLDDPFTCSGFGDGNPQILHTTFIEVAVIGNTDGSDPVCGGFANENDFLIGQAGYQSIPGARGTQIATYFNDAYNTNLPDWRMKTDLGGNPLLGNTIAPGAVGATAFVQATNYRGAVPAGLGGGIPWYSGWTRPWRGAITP